MTHTYFMADSKGLETANASSVCSFHGCPNKPEFIETRRVQLTDWKYTLGFYPVCWDHLDMDNCDWRVKVSARKIEGKE